MLSKEDEWEGGLHQVYEAWSLSSGSEVKTKVVTRTNLKENDFLAIQKVKAYLLVSSWNMYVIYLCFLNYHIRVVLSVDCHLSSNNVLLSEH